MKSRPKAMPMSPPASLPTEVEPRADSTSIDELALSISWCRTMGAIRSTDSPACAINGSHRPLLSRS
jgi:hypothetical protein